MSEFIVAIIGGIIGGGFVLAGVFIEHRNQIKREEERDKQDEKILLKSLLDEIETLLSEYMSGAGSHMEALEQGKPFTAYYPIGYDYYVVYNNNASKIGKIKNSDLRKLIVSGYTLAKSLRDTYALNNYLLDRWENAYWLHQQVENQKNAEQLQARFKALLAFTPKLKERHSRVKAGADDAIRAIRRELNLH